MTLFIMLKKCSNACALRCVRKDFNQATQEAYWLSKRYRVASYVLDAEQVRNIFSDQVDKLHDWCLKNFDGEIALSLPLNFKKFLR